MDTALSADKRTIIEREINLGFGLVNRDAQRLLDEVKRLEAQLQHKQAELETVDLLKQKLPRTRRTLTVHDSR